MNPPHGHIFTNISMALLNIGFAILIIKIAICTLPAAIGIALIVSSEESKREFRNKFCSKVFGMSNAIPYPKFARTMAVFGTLMLAFSLVSTWFLVLRPMLLIE